MRISDWSSDVCSSDLRIAQEMFRIAAGEYDELHEAATLADPEMTLVIGFGSGGQDRNSQALMHLTSLMDDATSERWIRRLEVLGTVEWQRFDVPVPRGRFPDCASAPHVFYPRAEERRGGDDGV